MGRWHIVVQLWEQTNPLASPGLDDGHMRCFRRVGHPQIFVDAIAGVCGHGDGITLVLADVWVVQQLSPKQHRPLY